MDNVFDTIGPAYTLYITAKYQFRALTVAINSSYYLFMFTVKNKLVKP